MATLVSAANLNETFVQNDNSGALLATANADTSATTLNNAKVAGLKNIAANAALTAYPLATGDIANGAITPAKMTTDYTQGALASTYSTASTTNVSAGLGVSLAVATTGALVMLSAIVANNTAGDGVQLAVYRSTTGTPAAGSAPGGTDTLVYQTQMTSSAANQNQSVCTLFMDTGLTAGTTYYYYVALAAVTGGTAAAVGGNRQTVLVVHSV